MLAELAIDDLVLIAAARLGEQSLAGAARALVQALFESDGDTLAVARELPRHREGVAVALEERLHQGAGGAGAHQLVAALLAHEQADRLGEQSLAGAGLAGDDVEARRELEARGGDEDQIVDRELSEHRGGRRASPRRSGRRTLRRSP